MAFIFIPLSVLTLSDLGERQRGNATGLFNLTRELGGSIGTAWMGMLIDDSTKIHAAELSEHVSAYSPSTQERLAALKGGLGIAAPEAFLQMKLKVQAMVMSFTDGFGKASVVFAIGLLLVLFLKRPQPGARIEGAH
jgi:DHA2 family multidrug resistance protein